MQEERSVTTASIEAIERAKNRLWRKSHSLNSIRTFDIAVRQFEKYLLSKQLTYEDAVKSPLNILDDFSAWLDRHHASGTIRTYIAYTKKLLLAAGAEIDHYKFKEEVVLPKVKVFEDDKVNEDQIRRLVLAIKHPTLKNLLMLMKDTQARPAEILGLKLQDFNLAYDPPYLNIPGYLAKNDIPRELFFTQETKSMLMSYLENKKNNDPNQFIFLKKQPDPLDEREFQRTVRVKVLEMERTFRNVMQMPEFKDLNQIIIKKGLAKRYKIHIYSFKKFAFTRMADSLGEIAARAIKGDKQYIFTYYKKSREERAEDYTKLIPKLSIFVPDDQVKIREQVEDAIKTLKKEDLAGLLEFIRKRQ